MTFYASLKMVHFVKEQDSFAFSIYSTQSFLESLELLSCINNSLQEMPQKSPKCQKRLDNHLVFQEFSFIHSPVFPAIANKDWITNTKLKEVSLYFPLIHAKPLSLPGSVLGISNDLVILSGVLKNAVLHNTN